MNHDLKELIRLLIEVAGKPDAPEPRKSHTVVVTEADLDGVFYVTEQPLRSKLGVQSFVPFSTESKFPPGSKFNYYSKRFGIDPWEIANTIKKNVTKTSIKTEKVVVTGTTPRGTREKDFTFDVPEETVTFTADRSAKRVYFEEACKRIADYFKMSKVDIVTCADSRSTLAAEMTEYIGSLMGLPKSHIMIGTLRKTANWENISINETQFEKWATGVDPDTDKKTGKPKSQKEVAEFRKELEDDLLRLWSKIQNRQKISIADNFKASKRKLFKGIHEVEFGKYVDDQGKPFGTVGIVDDNLDSGSTFMDLKSTFEEYKEHNHTPVFAAAFMINRPSVTAKASAKSEVEKEKSEDEERAKRYDAFKSSKSTPRVWSPNTMFSVGDAMNHPKFGLGVVEALDDAKGTASVNFSDGIKTLVVARPSSTVKTGIPMPVNKMRKFEESILRAYLRKMLNA